MPFSPLSSRPSFPPLTFPSKQILRRPSTLLVAQAISPKIPTARKGPKGVIGRTSACLGRKVLKQTAVTNVLVGPCPPPSLTLFSLFPLANTSRLTQLTGHGIRLYVTPTSAVARRLDDIGTPRTSKTTRRATPLGLGLGPRKFTPHRLLIPFRDLLYFSLSLHIK